MEHVVSHRTYDRIVSVVKGQRPLSVDNGPRRECVVETGETSGEGGRAGRRRYRVEAAVAVVAVWEGMMPGVCAAEAKASPSMAGDVLCFKLANVSTLYLMNHRVSPLLLSRLGIA